LERVTEADIHFPEDDSSEFIEYGNDDIDDDNEPGSDQDDDKDVVVKDLGTSARSVQDDGTPVLNYGKKGH
jgi:hypothetical protein